MSDSIDYLEAVGRDASLRRLPPDELAQRLRDAGASEVMASAAAQRDGRLLVQEFGTRAMHEPNLVDHGFEVEVPPVKGPSPEEEVEEEQDGEKSSLPASAQVH